jgi:aspartate/methionine/tyrosine aminotransferase
MSLPRWYTYSDYMEFSKQNSRARFDLGGSGVKSCSMADLGVRLEDLELTGPLVYGHAPLLEAIAAMKGVKPESVVHAEGTSMANHLAMSALFAPGDEVLIEEPTYEPMLMTALYLGARVRRFQRRWEDNFALDAEEVAKNLTEQTRLIVIQNLHNPSSALVSEETLRAIGAMAREVGARVLVDEVYLECLHHPPAPTAFLLGDEFVVTSSLTKAYGLAGLRCGWVLAEPELAERIWRLNDLFASYAPHIAEHLSVVAIKQIDQLTRRADAIVEANRNALRATLDGHPAIELTIPAVGTTVFPRLRQGDVTGFCSFLRDKYDTNVVPGRYFESPQHFRVGMVGDVETTREGLTRLARALNEWESVTGWVQNPG